VRDVGKALGLDLAQVDRLSGVFAWWDGRTIDPARIREAGFDPDNPLIARLVMLTGDLMGFPRHLSQHVGGFVIARGLLERMVPVENATMADRTVIQWDKDDLDAMGLLKVDCLALLGLARADDDRAVPALQSDAGYSGGRLLFMMCQRGHHRRSSRSSRARNRCRAACPRASNPSSKSRSCGPA
jgi:hypothetical protein